MSNWNKKGKFFKKTNNKNVSTSSETNQINIDTIFEVESCPYIGWRLYFSEEHFKENSNTHNKVKAFENYINRNLDAFSFDIIEEKKSFSVDLKKLLKDEFISDWNTFENDLNALPEFTINCLGVAMHQTLYNKLKETLKSKDTNPTLSKIHVRLFNHTPILQLKNLKVNYYGKLASVRGTVIRVSNVKLICHSMSFKCVNCEASQVIQQPDGVYTLPNRCITKLCKNRSKFIPILSSNNTITNNWQLLKLQESVGKENLFKMFFFSF